MVRAIRISREVIKLYVHFYPEYTQKCIRKALKHIKRKYGVLDAITVDHVLKPKQFGGLGFCKSKRERKDR